MKIENYLEQECLAFESQWGLEEICRRLTNVLPYDEELQFIDEYRTVVRSNSWVYPDIHEMGHDEFLRQWRSTHTDYLMTAAGFFEQSRRCHWFDATLPLDSRELPSAHSTAILSELRRGRVGKRSPVGLDARLNKEIVTLEQLLSMVMNETDSCETAELFAGTMDPSFISAEKDQVNKFILYRDTLALELTLENVRECDRVSNGLSTQLLREFCRYSLQDFNKKLTRFRRLTEADLSQKAGVLREIAAERHDRLLRIERLFGKDSGSFRKAIQTVTRITDLNYLNSNLEAKFSFKGWAGVLHLLVFECGRTLCPVNDIHERQSLLECNQRTRVQVSAKSRNLPASLLRGEHESFGARE